MSIAQIKKLRTEKHQLVNQYKAELQKVESDRTLSDMYKAEKRKECMDNVNKVRYGHDQQIKELIEQGKATNTMNIKKSAFDSLTEKELLLKLVITNEIKEIENKALNQYKGDVEALFEVATQEVENAIPTAQGYINALNKLNDSPFVSPKIERLEQQHQYNMMNSEQKKHLEQLREYEQQEAEYSEELKTASFEQKMEKYQ